VRGAQSYVERRPVPALAPRVRTVWIQQTGPAPYVQRNLPTGGIELQCLLGRTPRLVGPLTTVNVEVLPAGVTVVGARFWPNALASLLGTPADALLDSTVPADELWGDSAVRLGDQLAAAPGPEAALGLLQKDLVHRFAHAGRPDPLVTDAVRRLMPWEPVEIGLLTAQLAISSSQLRRRFRTAVGVGPKALQRTLRLQGYLALAQAAAGSAIGRVADLAADVGYADHAHLGRECLRLTGVPPGELLGGSAERCGCGHDHSASYAPFLAFRPDTARAG
jgi:AraC-like DNA-binding protein